MKLSDEQKEIVALTLQLNLQVKTLESLNKKLEALQMQNLNPNDNAYVQLRKEYAKNYLEIEKINKRLKQLNQE